MLRKLCLFSLIGFVCCNLVIGNAALHAGSHPNKQRSESKLIAKNTTRYQAYMVLNATTGQILEANKAFLKWPPASLTKLMLAYIVMQNYIAPN